MLRENKTVLLVLISRILTGLLILVVPFWGFIAYWLADYLDAYFLVHQVKFSFRKYHLWDKYLDWVGYLAMLIVVSGSDFFNIFLVLLLVRLIGQLVFLQTRKSLFFIFFPNFYEIAFFWFILGLSLLWLPAFFVLQEAREILLHWFWPRYLKVNGYPKFLRNLGYETRVRWD